MKNFREFKKNIVSKLKEKVAAALEVRKIEMARSMFSEAKEYSDEDWVVYDDNTRKVIKTFKGKNAGKEAVKFQKKEFSKEKQYVAQAASTFYESVDINEGMGAFKAAAEVLKAFGGKKPSKVSDMMKFDSEMEKAAKKYDVSVDDILKVINK